MNEILWIFQFILAIETYTNLFKAYSFSRPTETVERKKINNFWIQECLRKKILSLVKKTDYVPICAALQKYIKHIPRVQTTMIMLQHAIWAITFINSAGRSPLTHAANNHGQGLSTFKVHVIWNPYTILHHKEIL